jgi:Fe-S cluster biosynthesis and repair protein YggX
MGPGGGTRSSRIALIVKFGYIPQYGAMATPQVQKKPLQYSQRLIPMAHMVFCSRYKQEMEGLDEAPFDSDFGNKVYNNVSKKAWQEWVERQKMLLNEYRLQPWTPQAQEFLVEQMDQFFFGEGAALPKEYVPPSGH